MYLDSDHQTQKKYVAYVEQLSDIIDGKTNIILDSLTLDQYNRLNFIDTENLSRILSDIPTMIFSLDISNEQMKRNDFNFEIGSWIQFYASIEETAFLANVHDNVNFSDNFNVLYIEDIQPFDIKDKKNIFSMEIFVETNEENLSTLLNPIKPNMVIAYNVGQGNCNGICNERGTPLIYFDFGGGAYHNTKTYPGNSENPKSISFCHTNNPPVILSHWDWDHMVSATKPQHVNIKNSIWIVPKQLIGITHLKFAIELYNNTKLLIWPTNLSSLTTKYLRIQKIFTHDQKDKNNNGLSIIVRTENISNHYFVLLPGDANYSLLDLKEYKCLHGLVATHHGASSHGCLSTIPKASLLHTIAYSYGKNNTYKHPKRLSILEHKKSGWRNKKSTQNGHIALGTDFIINSMPCRTQCSLLPIQ